MKKKMLHGLLLMFLSVSYVHAADASDYAIHALDHTRIARHAVTIKKNEYRFSMLQKGIKLGAIAITVAGIAALYLWANEPVKEAKHDGHQQIIDNQKKILRHQKQGAENQEKTSKILEQLLEALHIKAPHHKTDTLVQPQLSQEELEQLRVAAFKDATKKPFLSGAVDGFVTWFTYIFNSSVTGTAVASSTYFIFQYCLPAAISVLDKVFYTFSYQWFVQHKTQMLACFEELERAACAYDEQVAEESEYQRRAFIWAYNQLLHECEYTIAFMHVQNEALDQYSFVHARHMRIVTKHFVKVIDRHKDSIGDAYKVPEHYTSWLDFVKSLRNKLRLEGESYAQNESYIFSRVRDEDIAAHS